MDKILNLLSLTPGEKEAFLAAGADGVLLNLSQLPRWLEEREEE